MYDYGLIGDMSSAALVGMDGSVDWLCLPRFDSPSVFAAILDQDIGGRFRIRPSGVYATAQSYVQDTNILETTFATSTGVVSVMDFMPIQDNDRDGKPDRNPANPPELHRIVRCSSGSVDMRCDYEPRHDYARAVPTFRAARSNGSGSAVETQGGGQTMMLLSGVPLHESADGVSGTFTLSQGETATFVMAYGPDRPATMEHYRTREKLRADAALLAGPCRGDALRGAVARSGGALLPRTAPDDLSRHRRHRRSADHEPPGDDRRFAELGLPILLAARHQLLRRHPL